MSAANFQLCLQFVLKYEGGFSDHPRDPGGATMRGVTLATYRRYRPDATVADLKAISDADVAVIYRRGYWDEIEADNLPAGVDLAAFDYAVNAGPGRARAALGATQAMDAVSRVKAICGRRRSFLQGLRTWRVFGRGWSARVAACEALGVRMALGSEATSGALENAALIARRKSSQVGKGVGASSAIAVGAPASSAADFSTGAPLWLLGAIAAAAVVAACLLFVKRMQERERAAAFELEALRARIAPMPEGA